MAKKKRKRKGKAAPQSQDVSANVVLALVVVALVVAVAGTWAVSNAYDIENLPVRQDGGSQGGNVGLAYLGPAESTVESDGNVQLYLKGSDE